MSNALFDEIVKEVAKPLKEPEKPKGVFSSVRTVKAPEIDLPKGLELNTRMKMDGRAY